MTILSTLRRASVRILVIANVVCTFHCISTHVADFTVCVGPSMYPAINGNSTFSVVINEHISAKTKSLQIGDVVIARSPTEPNTCICKRISAMSGDAVDKPQGYDGQSLNNKIRVPRGHLWLLGDNQDNSLDSRYYGPVPLALVKGRVCFKIWPLSESGYL